MKRLIPRTIIVCFALPLVSILPLFPCGAQTGSAQAGETQTDGQVEFPAAAPVPSGAIRPAATRTASSRKSPFPSLEDVTKDLKREDGLISIFYPPSPRQARDPEKLLALIPSRLLNKDLLFATSLSRGGQYTGWMWDDYLIRFQVRGRQLAIILPEVRYVRSSGNPVSEVIQRTYNASILTTAPIVAKSSSGEPVIDLGSLLKSNLAGLPQGGGVRRDLSQWILKKGKPFKLFPDNVLIEAELAVGGSYLSGGTSLAGVAYAFRSLPSSGYKPRVADDRVGYFVTAHRDWTKKHHERETFIRYINRWHLKKKDASLKLSPPERPITFIIEKTVPIQWRRWVIEGIEVWNKAFEKIGFTGAIQVLQQTDDNDLKDIDPEDARYNFFRWIVSGQPFAMGPSRIDPRTGQILDADIIFDDSMVRSWIQDFNLFTPRALVEAKGPGFRAFLERNPNLRIPGMEAHDHEAGKIHHQSLPRKMGEEKFKDRGLHFCDFSFGLQHQIALGYYMFAASSRSTEIPEELIGEAIRETVTHEIGHTLGLRHNFKGSSWLSLEEIKRRRFTDEPTSASIMDYNPILFLSQDDLKNAGHFITPTIGPYDYWAIEYGYKVPGSKDGGEKQMLAKIAQRCAEPGLAYATDEDSLWAYCPDPLVGRFDSSSDPFLWARERIQLVDRLMGQVADVAVAPGDSRYFLTRAFETLMMEKGMVLEVVSKWIGGQHFNRDHRGDPGGRAPFVLVPAKEQREALNLLDETLFRDKFFEVPAGLLNQLAPSRWTHWGSSTPLRMDYPIHDRIRMLQWYTLLDLLSAPILQRIYDAELKSGEADRLTVMELLTSVCDQIWKQVGKSLDGRSPEKPYISSIARGLQREHLELLLGLILSPADGNVCPDLHAIICGMGRELSEKLARTLEYPDKLDLASRAHLVECKSRLDRALEAQFQRGR